MNYSRTLDFLFTRLPMFTRQGASAYRKDLTNIIFLCNELGNPQKKLKFIHIGGTNGKGSSSHMIASILQKAGYKTGLYTSPHLKDFRERIKINGKMIPKSKVVNFVNSHQALIPKIEPSFFELTLSIAFDYFYKENVDIVVLEVGLGGRLDSTNLIDPELSLITNISLDHTNILGNTIKEIAVEKAGIIKSNKPIIIGESQKETDLIFLKQAKKINAPIQFADKTYKSKNIKLTPSHLVLDIYNEDNLVFKNLKLDLKGSYQTRNVLNVISVIIKLRKLGYEISEQAIYAGLSNVCKITGLKGRWQTLEKSPKIICDTGHNEAGIKEVLKNINTEQFSKLHFVLGMVKDKDISNILQLLPKNATYYYCAPNIERALPVNELNIQAKNYNLTGMCYSSVEEAVNGARQNAKIDDLIFIGGSTFVVAEII